MLCMYKLSNLTWGIDLTSTFYLISFVSCFGRSLVATAFFFYSLRDFN